MTDILSEYTDVSVTVNLNKLAKWMYDDDSEEFKKMLPSLPVDLVSESDILLATHLYQPLAVSQSKFSTSVLSFFIRR